eukprot:c6466_g1_i2.p2 GENE.c6466_g1_i2~~c6466_g1_i2.p2  ORF type:complete len:149 (+),score=24.15 c6466_g1_i2:584-1030(+)
MDCPSELRFYWAHTKLNETPNVTVPTAQNPIPFFALPFAACTPDNLRAAYEQDLGFCKDGLLFYNKEAHYTPGTTPLSLLWMDGNCSKRYFSGEQTPVNAPAHTKKLSEAKVFSIQELHAHVSQAEAHGQSQPSEPPQPIEDLSMNCQ